MNIYKVLCPIFLVLISISAHSQDRYPNVKLSKKLFEEEKHVRYVAQLKGDKYGFVNEEYKFSIKPKFDNAAAAIPYMGSYLYPVCYDGKWGLLNQDGSYKIFPTLDTCPIDLGYDAVLCHREDKIFIAKQSEMIEYDQLSYKDDILYIPKAAQYELYIQNNKTSFSRSEKWFKTPYPDKGIYVIHTKQGSFFFDSKDDCPVFSRFGPADSYKLDYTRNPNVHAIWTGDDISLWTDTDSLIVSGCNAVTPGEGYVVGLKMKDNKLYLYDNETLVINLECQNKADTYIAQSELVKSLEEKFIRPLKKHQVRDYLSSNHITSATINATGVDYIYTTGKKGQCVFWNIGGKIMGVFRDGCTFDVIDAENGHVKIVDGNKYGFINMKTGLVLRPALNDESALPEYNEPKRYKYSFSYGIDEFIADTERRYSIEEYEQYLYNIFLENKTENCSRYLDDYLLSGSEKLHYDEVRWTRDIISPYEKWRTDVKTMEESVDGNIYTYDVVTNNGFVIRQKRTSTTGQKYKPEIVIDDFGSNLYITVEEFTGFTGGSLRNLSLIWKKQIGDAVYALYDFKREDGQEYVGTAMVFNSLVINPITGVPVVDYAPEEIYETRWKSVYNFVKINENGIQNRIVLPNENARIGFDFEYIVIKSSPREIVCMDYDFNTIYNYKASDNTYISDCISFEDKWILVGSTTESGYVGYQNYYLIVTDNDGNMISTSYFPVKDGRLISIRYLDSNVFEVTGTNNGESGASEIKQISVDSDGILRWL